MSLNARSYVFDAGAISLYYAGSKAAKPYFDRVNSGSARGFVSEVNLAEFYYKTGERMGMETAEHWYVQVRRSRIRCVPPNEQITRVAAVWKVKRRDLSLADCFALATREDKAQTLLTTDSVLKDAGGRSAVLLAVS
ncbi:MAG: PIN domain-containing protein [Thaumarchaeota archaeon]|nr:PIN domain-containing protein [Nitrososphaerota archaeon]